MNMTTTITWYGHSTFGLDINGTQVLVDPFFSGNPATTAKAASIPADFILVTHGHGDHIGDTVAIAKRTGATVISNFEICNWVSRQGHDKIHAQHIGGGFNHPFGYVKLTIAEHGSALPDGSYGGNPAGLLMTIEQKKMYIAGDTGLFLSMQLYGDEGIDVAFLPIGDNFTMGPVDALKAVKLLHPKKVVPIHYGTWPLVNQNAATWKEMVQKETTSECILMSPGDKLTI
jgi:L-ascorbate metabolism protein UlaG (beta-lactamase superfamily)